MRDMSFGLDASFSDETVVERQNSDLANDLGNLFSRSLAMINKFSQGAVPEPMESEPQDIELAEAATAMAKKYIDQMNSFAFSRALQSVWKVISLANKYIVTSEPWVLAKDPAKTGRLNTVLYHLAETLRLISLVMEPITPATSRKMRQSLGLIAGVAAEPNLVDHSGWGLTKPGQVISAGPPLFPRLDKKKQEDTPDKTEENNKPKTERHPVETSDNLISFDDFKKLDLRVADITAAEKIATSDRLLKLTVLAPEERTVVAGIAEFYQPEDLIGRQVIMVANLKPAKLMGVFSQGMILAARDESGKLSLSGISDALPPGSTVS
jgi:methionyl-tRNA synthetase